MFIHNIVALLNSGIRVTDIFSSVFTLKVEFNEWPRLHQIPDNIIVPYNECPCDLRYKYDEIFSEIEARAKKNKVNGGGHAAKHQINKVRYSLNLLPSILRDERTKKNFLKAI